MQLVKEVLEMIRPNIHFVTTWRISWFQYYFLELNIHALSQKGHRTDFKITGGKQLYIDMSLACGICFSKTDTVMIIITLDTHKHNKQNHKRKIP